MGKTRKEIECLCRLQEVNASYEDILVFLLAENMITKEEIKVIRSSSEVPKRLQAHLANLSKANKLQLLEYEWTILPVERIKLVIVTDRDSREFSYNF